MSKIETRTQKECINCKKLVYIIEREHCHTCYSRLKRHGIISNIVKPELPKNLTPLQIEVLNGVMLGDGSLSINKNEDKSVLNISRQLNDKDYLDWQFSIFENLCLSPVGTGSRYDK